MPISQDGLDKMRESDKAQVEGTKDIIEASESALKKIIKAILSRIRKMTDGEVISDTKKANRQLSALRNDLKRIIRQKKFFDSVGKYLKTFETVEGLVIDASNIINGITVQRATTEPAKEFFKKTYWDLLQGNGIEEGLIEPHIRELNRLIVTGGDIGDIEKGIIEFAEGNRGIVRYVTQTSRDGLNQFEGMANKKIADAFKIEWFVYTGSLIATSRPQCRRWVEFRYLHKSELEAQINWALSNGSGMIKETTPATFAVYRGGYSCRHQVYAIDSSLVPQSAFDRVGIDWSL